MLLIGLEKNNGSLVMIRHLPARKKKNWTKTSGPILHLKMDIAVEAFSELVAQHFDAFERRIEPEDSEFDTLSARERQELFASYRFVAIHLIQGHLMLFPSEVLDPAQYNIRFGSREEASRVKRPWKAEELWLATMSALQSSKNRAFDPG